MDTGKEYIEMCRNAKEIQQEPRVVKAGDIYVKDGIKIVLPSIHESIDAIAKGENYTLLPRQDQLQDMLGKVFDYASVSQLLTAFENYTYWLQEHNFTSIEQVWLSFVMKDKYGKTWNGIEWVSA